MADPHDPRAVARQEATDAEHRVYEGLFVGMPGSPERQKWLEQQAWLAERKKRREAQKELAVSSIAGIGYGILGTAITGIVTWATGGLQWLLSILASHK